MTPPRTDSAVSNLRDGIKKMEKTMSPAAQVRRDFRLGRPPKAAEPMPMHQTVTWQKAQSALSNFRGRMIAAKLKPEHVSALIVYIEMANPDEPHVLLLESPDKSAEQMQAAAFEQLGRDDVIALGMLFTQLDEQAEPNKQQVIFPYQFMGLNERGIAVLKEAATRQHNAISLTKIRN